MRPPAGAGGSARTALAARTARSPSHPSVVFRHRCDESEAAVVTPIHLNEEKTHAIEIRVHSTSQAAGDQRAPVAEDLPRRRRRREEHRFRGGGRGSVWPPRPERSG